MLTSAQVSLSQSMALRAPSIEAATIVIAQGLQAPNNLSLRDMPAFSTELSSLQIEELARYLREKYAPDLPSWGR
jgi:nicotinate dehydrogenase subunit B